MCPWEPTVVVTQFWSMQQSPVGQMERIAKDPWFFKQVQEKKEGEVCWRSGQCSKNGSSNRRHEAVWGWARAYSSKDTEHYFHKIYETASHGKAMVSHPCGVAFLLQASCACAWQPSMPWCRYQRRWWKLMEDWGPIKINQVYIQYN